MWWGAAAAAMNLLGALPGAQCGAPQATRPPRHGEGQEVTRTDPLAVGSFVDTRTSLSTARKLRAAETKTDTSNCEEA